MMESEKRLVKPATKILRKRIKCLLGLLLCTLLMNFGSCQERSDNGALDGMWQLQQISYRADSVIYPVDLYMNFQFHLMALQIEEGELLLGRFMHTKDSLFIRMIEGDSLIYAAFGMESGNTDFKILTLTHRKLILQSQTAEIMYRKW